MTRGKYSEAHQGLTTIVIVTVLLGIFLILAPTTTLTHLVGLGVLLFWGGLGVLMWMTAMSYPVVPPFEEITDGHESYALEQYGYFVQELQEQYDERRRLLANTSRVSKRRIVLREMVRLSETRLQDIQENTCSSQN